MSDKPKHERTESDHPLSKDQKDGASRVFSEQATDLRGLINSLPQSDSSHHHQYPPKVELAEKHAGHAEKGHEHAEKKPTVHKDKHGHVAEIDYPKPPGGRCEIHYRHGQPFQIERHNADGTETVWTSDDSKQPCIWNETQTDKHGKAIFSHNFEDMKVTVFPSGEIDIMVKSPDQSNWVSTVLKTDGSIVSDHGDYST